MFRLIFGISILIASAIYGGWAGGILALIVLSVFGALFPPASDFKQTWDDVERDLSWERIEPARRGSNVDPTRPDDDHPLMLTHEISTRRSKR